MEGSAVSDTYAKHQAEHDHLFGAFGPDRFGQISEQVARFFGTPRYIVGQTIVVIIWIALNGAAISFRWDPYPFILLNLAFSTQAAYAAPLILLAQTRQADRDKASGEAAAKHRDELADAQAAMLRENTELTQQVAHLSTEIDRLTRVIHDHVCPPDAGRAPTAPPTA
ncbi:MAG: DUF1003 domain-containing protein [Actinobacteria bacterium]|nr:DUF1003 domain-containing protein [Actinomycetota bacterium]